MKNQRTPVHLYYSLGKLIIETYYTPPNKPRDNNQNLDDLCMLLRDLELNGSLATMGGIPRMDPNVFAPVPGARKKELINSVLKAIDRSIGFELNNIEVIQTQHPAIIEELLSFESTHNLTDIQKNLLKELIYCLEIGAANASTLLAWSFAFEVFRQYLYDTRLDDFNKNLDKKYRRIIDKETRASTPIYDPIVRYEDFYSGRPHDMIVLEIAENISFINSKAATYWKASLHTRNGIAHPGYTNQTNEQVAGYIQQLLKDLRFIPKH